MYGRLENNQLIGAPKNLVIDGQNVWNASAEDHLSQGWYPVIASDPPITDELHYAESYWEFKDNKIRQEWVIKQIDTETEDMVEAARILLGMD